jgi:hypothetical protein
MANQAVQVFVAQMKAYNDRDQLSIDSAIASTAGITADEAASAALIAQLQASQGAWTSEDQAALDELQALSKAKTEKLESATAALNALDATLPPVVPNIPPVEPPVEPPGEPQVEPVVDPLPPNPSPEQLARNEEQVRNRENFRRGNRTR